MKFLLYYLRKYLNITDLGAESASPGNSVKVGIGILWHVIVENNVHTLNVHATSKQIGGDQDTLLEILELLVPAQKDAS